MKKDDIAARRVQMGERLPIEDAPGEGEGVGSRAALVSLTKKKRGSRCHSRRKGLRVPYSHPKKNEQQGGEENPAREKKRKQVPAVHRQPAEKRGEEKARNIDSDLLRRGQRRKEAMLCPASGGKRKNNLRDFLRKRIREDKTPHLLAAWPGENLPRERPLSRALIISHKKKESSARHVSPSQPEKSSSGGEQEKNRRFGVIETSGKARGCRFTTGGKAACPLSDAGKAGEKGTEKLNFVVSSDANSRHLLARRKPDLRKKRKAHSLCVRSRPKVVVCNSVDPGGKERSMSPSRGGKPRKITCERPRAVLPRPKKKKKKKTCVLQRRGEVKGDPCSWATNWNSLPPLEEKKKREWALPGGREDRREGKTDAVAFAHRVGNRS